MSVLARYLLLLIAVPPIMACVWYVLARAWAAVVYGGNVPEKSIRRKKLGFKLVMIAGYAIFIVVGLAKGVF